MSEAPLYSWLPEPPSPELARLVSRIQRAADVCHVALMPDAHVAEDVGVGCVVATEHTLYPAAVGGDIGCGMAAVPLLNLSAEDLDERAAARILAGFSELIPGLHHRRGPDAPQLSEFLEARLLSHPHLERRKREDARPQLGTLGRGNHFLEIAKEPTGELWVLVHSGSRGIGRAIFEHHRRACDSTSTGLVGLTSDGEFGNAYLVDHDWARDYAHENRLAILEEAARVLCIVTAAEFDHSRIVHVHHNHVRREQHGGKNLWVHRKGAISALDGELGIVPGSMGTPTYLVAGRGNPQALASSAHGAGRQLSRGVAERTLSLADFAKSMRGVWFDRRRIDQLKDEAPAAYKDIDSVLRAQRDLVRIDRRLLPLLNYKG